MDGKIFLRAAGRLPQAAKDEMFGKLFGELVSNIPRAFLHTHRTLHHAHTVAITFSFLCGLIYCVRTLVTVSAKLSRA